MPWVIT